MANDEDMSACSGCLVFYRDSLTGKISFESLVVVDREMELEAAFYLLGADSELEKYEIMEILERWQ